MIRKLRLLLVIPLALVFLAMGCGKNKITPASLKGTVSYNGKPVTGGNMTLYGKDMGAYFIPINEDGSFEHASLPAGEMTVCVETETLNPNKPKYGQQGKNMPDSTPEGKKQEPKGKYQQVPRKYATPSESPLKVTLKAGENTENFELKD